MVDLWLSSWPGHPGCPCSQSLLLPGQDVLVPRRRCHLEKEAALRVSRWPERPSLESLQIFCIRLKLMVVPAVVANVLSVPFPSLPPSPRGRSLPGRLPRGQSCWISEFITFRSASTPNRVNIVPTALKSMSPAPGRTQLSFPSFDLSSFPHCLGCPLKSHPFSCFLKKPLPLQVNPPCLPDAIFIVPGLPCSDYKTKTPLLTSP